MRKSIWLMMLAVVLACTSARSQTRENFKKMLEDSDLPEAFYDNYIKDYVIPELIKARGNQTDPSKEADVPSIGSASTSLVDQSSAPDLISVALNLAGLHSSGNTDSDAKATSVTVTGSALKAYFQGHEPLDPFVYNRDRGWRRLSLTLGRETPEDKTAADAVLQQGTIYGFKYMLVDRRDLSYRKNDPLVRALSTSLLALTIETARIHSAVENYLKPRYRGDWTQAFELSQFKETFNNLEDEQQEEIVRILTAHAEPYLNYQGTVEAQLKEIRRKKQVALSYQAKNRTSGTPDDYKALLAYDVGNFTANLSYGRRAGFASGAFTTKTGVSAGAEYRVPLDKPDELSARRPRILSFSALADGAAAPRVYKAQAKLTIPISDGIEIPISLTAANRTEFINEGKIKGRIGVTFDLSKLKVENILDRAKSDNSTLQASATPTPTTSTAVSPTPAPSAS